MAKNNKRVKTGQQKPKKTATFINNPDSYNDQTPVWSFSICDFEHGKWGICRCVKEALKTEKIWKRLQTLETRTWREIKSDPSPSHRNSQNHEIEIHRLTKDAQKRLKQLNKDDYDSLFSLHIDNFVRVFGIREGRVFNILWFDLDHSVCPVRK